MRGATSYRQWVWLLAIIATAAVSMLALPGGAAAHVDSTAVLVGSPTDCNGNGTPNTSEPSGANRDDDGDGVCNAVDNCPFEPNADQAAAPNGTGLACQMQAITVPGVHLTYSGAQTTLEAIARYGGDQFMWDYGDGTTPTAWTAITNPYNLGISHIYSGAVGQTFTATVSVRDSANAAVVATATYTIEIVAGSTLSDPAQLDARARMAADAALWYLHLNETRFRLPDGTPGYAEPSGTWTQDSYMADSRCAAVDAFETAGHVPQGTYDTDPYVEDVQRGLSSMLVSTQRVALHAALDGNPDANGNGVGIQFLHDNSTATSVSQSATCLRAFADSRAPTRVAMTGGTGVNGSTYAAIGQDGTDWLNAAQIDNTSQDAGGWGYNLGAFSAVAEPGTQVYPVLALQGSMQSLGATVPPYVFSLLPRWLANTRYAAFTPINGAWGATPGNPPAYTTASATGAGLVGEQFIGNPASHPNVRAGVGFLYRDWPDAGTAQSSCWSTNLGQTDTMYAVSQGLAEFGLARVTDFDYTTGSPGTGSFDWFATPPGQAQTGYGTDLVRRQTADGSWHDTAAACGNDGLIASTAFDTMIVEAGLSVATPPPVANAGGPYTGTPGSTIQLDGSGSTGTTALAYAWDLNGDGTFSDSNVARPTFTIPSTATAGTTSTVCLKVTDGGGTSTTSCATVTVTAIQPPVCTIVSPTLVVSNTGGTMTIPVDGSRSSDPAGSPLTYRWSTNGGPPFADPTAGLTTQTGNFAHAGALVSWTDTLIVSNGTLSASCDATVTIVDNLPPALTVPGNLTVEATPTTAATINAWLASATASDPAANLPVPLANDFPGIPPIDSPLVVTWTATNPYDSAVTSQATAIVKVVDTTPPVLTLPPDIVATSSTVTYTATASDFVDGDVPVTCNPPSGSTFDAGTTTVTCRATDNAGNTATGTFHVTVTDTSPPVIASTLTGTLGTNGWYTSDVGVTWSVTDPDSALAAKSGCDDRTVSTDTSGTTFTCTATSAGGTASKSVTVKRDTQGPTIGAARAPAANAAGWNDSDVTATFSCADTGAGVGTCPAAVVFGAGVGQSRTVTATDLAGNSATFTVSDVNVDEAAPTLTGAATTPPNAHGWYSGDVTIHWTCADTGGSGIAAGACPADDVISGEGAGLVATSSVADVAGNVTPAKSHAVNIDRTPPVTLAAAPSTWSSTGVTVTLSATDNASGVDASYWALDGGAPQTGASIPIGDEGTHTVAYWSVDNAGNVEPQHTVTVSIDKTGPTITHTALPAPNAAGWNNTDVTVTFECHDALSGIASCALAQLISTEGQQAVTGKAVDNAGNTATDTAHVSIDKTSPIITAAADRAPNASGWYNADVIVSFTCNDPLSGVVSCPAPVRVKEGAAQFVTRSTSDAAGNVASATIAGLNVDETPPMVTFTGATTYSINDTVSITCTPSDALSGVASTTGCVPITGPAWSFGPGTTSRTATATDRAGNTGTGSVSFTVGVTCAGVEALIGQFVTNAGVASSLTAKLAAICTAPNATSKSGKLGAFDNAIDAQTGKAVTAARAKLLKQLAASL